MMSKKMDSITIKLHQPELEEGIVQATVREVKILKHCNTQYGQKDVVEIIYSIDKGCYEMRKVEKIYVSSSLHSRFMELLIETYGYNYPEEPTFKELEGQRCQLTIEHTYDEIGNKYANIVSRHFFNQKNS